MADLLRQGVEFKKCPRCKQGVYKFEGCNCVKCKCGGSFCYICNKDITDVKPDPHHHFSSASSCKMFDVTVRG